MLIPQSENDRMTGFVVFEGIDGCGKSSVARLVAERIGKRAVLTREPTESWIGKAVRKGDKHKVSPYTDALLFMADRAQHSIWISEQLKKGKLVLSDRYYHSTVAYQAAYLKDKFDGDAFKWLLEANERISLHPELTVLLVISPESALERIRGTRSKLSRFEKLDFLREVHSNYLKLARQDRSIVKVDAKKDLGSVVEKVLQEIKKRKL
ncbi:MAG: dTMP kinase [Thermoplasmatota archaeon]|nr:dTMP kinase [Candidatus Thermoplasmatota archaeon]MBU1913647.1 dTMP kinase [Candidatus Thermoplasmatota archaeon]